jgi:hypothetical protein
VCPSPLCSNSSRARYVRTQSPSGRTQPLGTAQKWQSQLCVLVPGCPEQVRTLAGLLLPPLSIQSSDYTSLLLLFSPC